MLKKALTALALAVSVAMIVYTLFFMERNKHAYAPEVDGPSVGAMDAAIAEIERKDKLIAEGPRDPIPEIAAELERLFKELDESVELGEGKALLARILKLLADQLSLLPRGDPLRAKALRDRGKALAQLHSLLLSIGDEEPRQRALEDSLRAAREYVDEFPRDAEAHFQLASTLGIARPEEPEVIRKELEECLRLDPGQKRCRENLASLRRGLPTASCRAFKSSVGFHLAEGDPPQAGKRELGPEHFESASLNQNPEEGTDQVNLLLNAEGTELLARLTGANAGKKLAFVVGGRIVMAPVIQASISNGRVLVSMGEGASGMDTLQALCISLDRHKE